MADESRQPHATSPFHPGEQAVQAKLGLRERLETTGRRMIRAAMTEEARTFFATLPTLVIGALDAQDRPWAGILHGQPGFVAAPDDGTLAVAATPAAGDPVSDGLVAGAPVGLLGIAFPTRRRNRANGVVRRRDAAGFEVAVRQSFGNCPKYIQARVPLGFAGEGGWFASQEGPILSDAALSLVRQADTAFIATASGRPRSDEPAEGLDVSHRGGPPGFAQASLANGATHIVMPDYIGNFLFNSFGNIVADPRAGLTFVDFDTGDLLQLTGLAEIDWREPDPDAFPGAERLLRFVVRSGRLARAALPIAWSDPEPAPQLARF